MKQKPDKPGGFLLQSQKALNIGAGVLGLGFLAYLALSGLGLDLVADILVIVFAPISLWIFWSAAMGRQHDKELVSYSLLWGIGALCLLLCGCAVLTIRLRLGLS